ncbi:unnamed protein product, partial [marine sediment metagenome]
SSFTLIELVVAIAILAMIISFAGVIFKVSIGAYRIAIANAEIMRKLRAITDQLNTDFKGVRKGMPIVVWRDRIVFLANGDFQSFRQYGLSTRNKKTAAGNLASIFYGITDTIIGKDEEGNDILGEPILSRGQMILTADPCLPLLPPSILGEYCHISFYEFRANAKKIFGNKETWAGKNLPPLDITSEQDLTRYMIKGISDFKIEYAYWNNKKLDWFSGNNV